jgi:mRNA-degrading endonuclease HigB of HigAB toxin-antitoxin module
MNLYYEEQTLDATTETYTAASGTLKLQVSNDDLVTPVSFADLPGSEITLTGDGNYIWNVSAVSYRWVRVVFTYDADDITLSLNFTGKGE